MSRTCASAPRPYLGPVCCPHLGEHERCIVPRGTEPFLFLRPCCARVSP